MAALTALLDTPGQPHAAGPGQRLTRPVLRMALPACRATAGIVLAALLAVPGRLWGQQGADAPRGSVAGSIFLVTPGGARLEVPGRTIVLLRDSDALRASLDETCRVHRQQTSAAEDSLDRIGKEAADTMQPPTDDPWTVYWEHEVGIRTAKIEARAVLLSQGRSALRRILEGATVDSHPTVIGVRYRFAGLEPGPYILHGELSSDAGDYRWWAPITVAAGASLTRDLQGTPESRDALFCGHR